MNQWFRYYAEALNDRKVQALPDALFKNWINVLCIACSFGGVLPSAEDVSFGLRVSVAKARQIVAELFQRGLLDPIEGGYFAPHNWNGRQFKSDVSNERVKRWREQRRNGECNVTQASQETPPEPEPDTDSKTEIGKKEDCNFGRVNGGQAGKQGLRDAPKHLAKSIKRGRIFIRKDTEEWAQYADDFKSAHNGIAPEPNEYGGTGRWFNITGEHPIPKRA